MCGIAERLTDAIRDAGTQRLTIASNNAGIDGEGLGKLLRTRQVAEMISSCVGENKKIKRQFLSGELGGGVSPARHARRTLSRRRR